MKITKVLITGIAGSGGSYLAEYIANNHPEVEIHGLAYSRSTRLNLKTLGNKITQHEADLKDFGSVFSKLDKLQPDAIFHFAAFSNVRHLDPGIQLCSTSEVYGQVDPKDVPIKEIAPLKPASPYAVSKATQDLLGWSYFTSYQMRIIRTRMFTYLNPRRSDLFASSFAKQVAWIERDLQKELSHGNLESIRTIIDMRDAMRAYWLAILHCRPGEAYNIGGTIAVKVGDFLDQLIALSSVTIKTRCDPDLLRPADVTLQIPCIDKFSEETGWKPQYSFEESVAHLLEYWRRKADEEVRLRSLV